jgi:hypothetical protein
MGEDSRDKGFTHHIGAALNSQAAGTIVGIITLLGPIGAALVRTDQFTYIVIGVETVLLFVVIGSQAWLRRAYLRLRRANAKSMSNPAYFELVQQKIERELTAGYESMADGHQRVYATEVKRRTLQLLRTLGQAPGANKIVRATDLTTDPRLLEGRSEYLAENRRFILSGGAIKRLFIARRQDLLREDYARPMLALFEQHRSIGVQCGLAVLDQLPADQAVDYVIFGDGAVLIEDQQGNVDYTIGRSSVDFKNVDVWIDKYDTIWPVSGVPTPAVRLQRYEAVARQLLNGDKWDALRVGKALDSVD